MGKRSLDTELGGVWSHPTLADGLALPVEEAAAAAVELFARFCLAWRSGVV